MAPGFGLCALASETEDPTWPRLLPIETGYDKNCRPSDTDIAQFTGREVNSGVCCVAASNQEVANISTTCSLLTTLIRYGSTFCKGRSLPISRTASGPTSNGLVGLG
jgi:hypothetical protein